MHYELPATETGIALMYSDVEERVRFLELKALIDPSELWLFSRLAAALGLTLFEEASAAFAAILADYPESQTMTGKAKLRLFMQKVPGYEAVRLGRLCTAKLEAELEMSFPGDSGMKMFEGFLGTIKDRILTGTLSRYLNGHQPSTKELVGLVLYSMGLES